MVFTDSTGADSVLPFKQGIELLWSQTYTIGKEFATQSVSLPKLAEYSNVIIKCVLGTNNETNASTIIYGGDAKTGTSKQLAMWHNAQATRYRTFVVGNTGIAFADAFYNGSSKDNRYFYPIAMYGYNE